MELLPTVLCLGIFIITRSSIQPQTTPATAGRSPGRATSGLPQERRWSVICKAESKPTPTCSRRCPRLSQGRGKTLFRQRHPSPRLYGGGFPGRTGGGNAFLSGGRPGPAGGAAVLRPLRHTTRGGADYGTEAAYHALESAPKPGECSKAGDHPERPKKPPRRKNDPGTVTAALRAAVRASMHFDSKMPLVRGSAPDTPAPPKVPSI